PEVVDTLKERVARLLETGSAGGDGVRFDVAADLRYVGQEYALTLPLQTAEVAELARHADTVAGRFHHAYHTRYGHANPREPVEFVAVRVAAVAELRHGNGAGGEPARSGAPPATTTVRFAGRDTEAKLYRRDDVPREVAGPAIVIEETSTTLVGPGWVAAPVSGGHLLLERSAWARRPSPRPASQRLR